MSSLFPDSDLPYFRRYFADVAPDANDVMSPCAGRDFPEIDLALWPNVGDA